MTRATDGAVSLRECPFCGDPMKVNISDMIEHVKQTEGCPLRQHAVPVEAIAAWNARHDAQRELIEALEVAFAALSCAAENGFYVGEGVFARMTEALSRHRPTDAELVDTICRESERALAPIPGEQGHE